MTVYVKFLPAKNVIVNVSMKMSDTNCIHFRFSFVDHGTALDATMMTPVSGSSVVSSCKIEQLGHWVRLELILWKSYPVVDGIIKTADVLFRERLLNFFIFLIGFFFRHLPALVNEFKPETGEE